MLSINIFEIGTKHELHQKLACSHPGSFAPRFPANAFLVVFHPQSRYENGRPTWLGLGGRRSPHIVRTELRPSPGSTYLALAFYEKERDIDAVPIDQMEYGRLTLYREPAGLASPSPLSCHTRFETEPCRYCLGSVRRAADRRLPGQAEPGQATVWHAQSD